MYCLHVDSILADMASFPLGNKVVFNFVSSSNVTPTFSYSFRLRNPHNKHI